MVVEAVVYNFAPHLNQQKFLNAYLKTRFLEPIEKILALFRYR